MKKLFAMFLCAAACAASAFAASGRLESNEVSASNLKLILNERFGTSIDDDGTVIVKKGKYFKVLIKIDSENKRLMFFHAWVAKPGAAKSKCLEKANQWNIDRAFNTVIYDAENKRFIWFYYLAYTGGLNSTNLLDTVEVLLNNEEELVKNFYEAGLLE